jgi:hypothetical protein
MKNAAPEPIWNSHNPCGRDCGRGIIHVFLIFFAQAMPAAIFGFAVGFFTFLGSAIPSLRFTVISSFPG